MKRRSIGICWQGPVTKELSQSIASSPSDFVHVVSTWKDKNWELYGEKVLEALRAKETIAGGVHLATDMSLRKTHCCWEVPGTFVGKKLPRLPG